MIAVLFARNDSRYKTLDGYNVYDIERDARTFHNKMPVIAHPPCRAWGMLSHMANPRPDEKQLAYYALAQVRLNGGILEHPISSRFWKELNLTAGGGKMNLVDTFLKLTNGILTMWLTKKQDYIFVGLKKIYYLYCQTKEMAYQLVLFVVMLRTQQDARNIKENILLTI